MSCFDSVNSKSKLSQSRVKVEPISEIDDLIPFQQETERERERERSIISKTGALINQKVRYSEATIALTRRA